MHFNKKHGSEVLDLDLEMFEIAEKTPRGH